MLLDEAQTAPVPPGTRERVCDRQGQEIDLSVLAPLLSRLVERYHPEQIWLFGSRARGEARPESDWDVLVTLPDTAGDEEFDPVEAWRQVKSSRVRADVVLCTLGELREDMGTPNTLFYEIARDGILLYER